jgi:hypothetical protein
MASLKTQDWNSSKEKNFKARLKEKTNSHHSQFVDEFDETANYPKLNRYKKKITAHSTTKILKLILIKRKNYSDNFSCE